MTPIADPTAELDRAHLKGLTVLYAEDDGSTREQMSVLLRRRVGRLVVAKDGREGLESFKRERPALVITDVQMPHLDGISMAAEIRKLEAGVPLVITTAFEQPEYFLRSIELGVDKYIVKPVALPKLDAAMLHCAHRLRAEQELARRGRVQSELRRQQAIALLAAGMAHDYNNLMQVIVANVSLAHETAPSGSELAELLSETEASARQAKELSQMLTLVSNGGMFEREPVGLVGLLTQVVGEIANDAKVTQTVTLAPGVAADVAVRGDRRHLGALFAALVTNAVEAMPDGGALDSLVSLAQLNGTEEVGVEAGAYLHVALRDSGRGVPAELLPVIFEPYFSTKERGTARGTGLGLTMCRSIAQRHHGAVTAESTFGEGTTVHVYLPVA